MDAGRWRAALLGGALGDAMGAAVEFWSLEETRARLGAEGVTEPLPAYGHPCPITDDTQMTLATAEGILAGGDRAAAGRQALDRWFATQRDPAQRRAPGNTCLAALRSQEVPARNGSKGCGAVMRMAPAARCEDAWEAGVELGWLTHGHPAGYEAAGAFALMVRRTMLGDELALAARAAWDRARAGEVREAIGRALDGEPFERHGEGWVAEECLGLALHCALTAPDFVAGVRAAVNHSGDSDSTGAVAGTLLGLRFGEAALPGGWLARLERREEIARLAEALAA